MKTLFLWPQEPFLPTSLFKHYVYIGETAAAAKKAGSYFGVSYVHQSPFYTSYVQIAWKYKWQIQKGNIMYQGSY